MSRFCRLLLLASLCQLKAFSQTADCGDPPENVAIDQTFQSDWRNYECSAQYKNGKENATLPIDGAAVPFGVEVSQNDTKCTDSEKKAQNATQDIREYLYNNQSLREAECGYRVCKLLTAHADDQILTSYMNMCGGAGDDNGGVTLVSKPNQLVPIEPIDFGKTKEAKIEVQLANLPLDVPFYFRSSRLRVDAAKVSSGSVVKNLIYWGMPSAVAFRGTLNRAAVNEIPLKFEVPSVRRGRPELMFYDIQAGVYHVFGYITVSRLLSDDETRCSAWNDQGFCEKCIYSTGGWSVLQGNARPASRGSFDCFDMPSGSFEASINGGFEVLPDPTTGTVSPGASMVLHLQTNTSDGEDKGQGSGFQLRPAAPGTTQGGVAHIDVTVRCTSDKGVEFCQAASPGALTVEAR